VCWCSIQSGVFLCCADPTRGGLQTGLRTLLDIEAVRRRRPAGTGNDAGSKAKAGWVYFLTPLGCHLAHLPLDVRLGKVGGGLAPSHRMTWCCIHIQSCGSTGI
jgi:hypothetical protein